MKVLHASWPDTKGEYGKHGEGRTGIEERV